MFYFVEHMLSGVGVIDKAAVIIDAVEAAPRSLTDLVAATGFSRATTHRLATALEIHGFLRRDGEGRFALGPRLLVLGRSASASWPLAAAARPALTELRDRTGESAQLYVRVGDNRVCVASLESLHGLRTIVGTGATLPLDQGSGGSVLLGAAVDGGWVASVAEREAGVASVSAPIVDGTGAVVAAVGVSGPVERLTRDPGPTHGPAVVAAAVRIAHDAGLTDVDL